MAELSPLRRDAMVGVPLFAAAALLPWINPSNYILGQATLFIIWAAVVTQWNLVLGVAGIMSIGHMALFAAGGYTVALLGLYFGVSPWLSLPVAGLAGVLVSLVLGLTTLRLRGAYVVVITLCVAMVMYQLIVTDVACFRKMETVCYSLTGGARGLARFGDFGFNKLVPYKFIASANYLVALACLLVGTIFAVVVAHSPYGKAFQALRDNEVCAASRGIAITKYQLIVFAAAGFFTGLSGGVYAGTMKTFGPQVLELPTLLLLLSMMVVGGRGHVWGPIVGATVLAFVNELFRGFAQWSNSSYAVVLILMLIFIPNGVAGQLGEAFRWLNRKIFAKTSSIQRESAS